MRTKRMRVTLVTCVIGAALLGMMIGAMFALADVVGNTPGLSMALPFVTTETVDATSDARDVYSFHLNKGATIEASMTGAPGTDFDLWIFPPGTTDILSSKSVPWGHSASDATSTEDFTMVAYTAGTYYLDVHAMSGSGAYELNVHNIAAVPFKMGSVSAPKTAKQGKWVRVSTSLTPMYNNDHFTPIKFYFWHWENHHWKPKGYKWGLGWQDVGRTKSLVWTTYKYPKRGSWKMRAVFWDPAHAAGMKTLDRKITIK